MSGSILTWLLNKVMGQKLSVQQVSLVRKLIYIGLILVLFTISYFFRTSSEKIIDTSFMAETVPALAVEVPSVETQAKDLALRERDLGDVDLVGSGLRIGLGGLRGVTTCVVWMLLQDKQKKEQWEEMDILVTTATKLQPHFNTPWQFQSWNMAFNVANRCDRPGEKYFYMARGIELLAQGERQNRYDPELRFPIGLYYQMRIGRLEYWPLMHALMEMSCMDPLQRDPARFQHRTPDQSVLTYSQIPAYQEGLQAKLNQLPSSPDARTSEQKTEAEQLEKEIKDAQKKMDNFDTFCITYPRFIRRLREPPNARIQQPFSTPEEIVVFLDQHRDIPSLYLPRKEGLSDDTPTERKRNKDGPFPVWPQDPPEDPEKPQRYEYDPEQLPDPSPQYLAVELASEKDPYDLFMTARSWFRFAQKPLPRPNPDRPGESMPIENPVRQRIPKRMTTVIFRDYPARASSYVAERLAEEGWFDEDGWLLEWDASFKRKKLPLGKDVAWGRRSWEEAYKAWEAYGNENGMQLGIEELQRLNTKAEAFRKQHVNEEGMLVIPKEGVSPELEGSYRAYDRLKQYSYTRGLTNFPHHFHRANVEQQPQTVATRKAIYNVQKQNESGLLSPNNVPAALEAVLEMWRGVLMANPEFAADTDTQTTTQDMAKKYNAAFVDSTNGQVLKKLLLIEAALAQSLAPDMGLQTVQAFRWARAPVVIPPEGVVYAPHAVELRYTSVIGQAGSVAQTLPFVAAARLWAGPGAVISPDGPLDDFGRPVFRAVPRVQ